MRHLLVFAVLLLACDNVFSQPSEDMLNNVIQITTTFSNGEKDFGFGFVVAQRNDVLYFVTAKHVVQKDDPDITSQKIEVRFYSDKGKIVVATKLDLPHKDMDIALLEVPKPQSYSFVNECLADCAFKDEVYFIGRKKDWYFPMGNQTGNIINSLSDEGTIKVAITSIRPGTSGAPLLNSSGIVGMVIRDSDDNEADAIGIKIIKDVIEKTWKYPFQLTDVKKGRFTDQRDDPAI